MKKREKSDRQKPSKQLGKDDVALTDNKMPKKEIKNRENITIQENSRTNTFIKKSRFFLAENKIFFETIAAFSLTLMAVIISWVQLGIAQKQIDLLELQTQIERQQASPQFVVIARQYWNDEKTFAADDKILIYNQGNIAYNIDVDTAVFFKLTYISQAEYKEVLVPINGYYTIHLRTGDATGLVMTLESDSNNLKRWQIQDELGELAKNNGVTINLEVQRYLKLTYRDTFDVEHTQYYFVPLIYGGDLLETAEGEEVFSKKFGIGTEAKYYDLYEVTAQELFNLFP
ncbi:MAG: hypothetical protein FD146_2529 [Anaerolineaceae bacterium]|nr:MAG: hypothetical protein FD146_2529 [Anaerolineaceae bacterium]